jgi:large subunit ribosomal protein L15
MNLNTISPDPGSKPNRRRVGRGIGSGLGKTSGKGHKGQKARAGGYHKVGFEGGQMPIQRRLPKMGFKSRVSKTIDQITLGELAGLGVETVDLEVLRDSGLINKSIREVKVILSGEINVPLKLKGLRITKGARAAIEQAGGSIVE